MFLLFSSSIQYMDILSREHISSKELLLDRSSLVTILKRCCPYTYLDSPPLLWLLLLLLFRLSVCVIRLRNSRNVRNQNMRILSGCICVEFSWFCCWVVVGDSPSHGETSWSKRCVVGTKKFVASYPWLVLKTHDSTRFQSYSDILLVFGGQCTNTMNIYIVLRTAGKLRYDSLLWNTFLPLWKDFLLYVVFGGYLSASYSPSLEQK